MIAGCSVSFFCDMSPCAQLTENPNIFLSLGVTPLSQAEKLRWSLTAIASHEHTGALLKTAPAPWLMGGMLITGLSWPVQAPAERAWKSPLGLYYCFVPFTFPQAAFFHQSPPTVPRWRGPGEFTSSAIPCAKQPTCVDSEPFGLDVIISMSLLKVTSLGTPWPSPAIARGHSERPSSSLKEIGSQLQKTGQLSPGTRSP